MIQLGSKSIDSIYLGNKVVTEAYIGSRKIWPDSSEEENYVAILSSEDGTITQYFESCADAATYATNNSDTNWNLTIRSGDVPASCFRSLTNLISLTLEDGVTSIGNYAFYYCPGFTGDLVIPDSVTSIGDSAFQACNGLDSNLTIGNGVITIGASVFRGCYFTGSLTIPNSVNSIGNAAFRSISGFTGSLTIPGSVTSIGNNVFYECSGFDDDLSYYGKVNPGASYNQQFSYTPFTVCKVPTDYEDDEFCGKPVSKVIGGGTIDLTEAENGVYVYAKNGLLSTVDDWDTNANDYAVGIAVITDNAKFVIKKGIGSTAQTCWSTSLYGVAVGSVYATDKTAAIADYAGYNNTQIIHEAAPDESTTNNAANYCLAQTITTDNGTLYGYLPSAGEVYEIYNNLDTINNALELIGSDVLDSSKYGLCSTSQDDSTAWRILLGTSSGAEIAKNTVATDVFAIPLFQLNSESE